MLAFFGVPLISFFLFGAGFVPYRMWSVGRRPSAPARWAVIGAFTAVVGYAGAVVYGLAFTDPAAVCGQRTLDDDFPLVRVTVDAFPPDVACHWTDSGSYGPSHPAALGTWVMWAGLGVFIVALSVLLVGRTSRAAGWARAGAIGSFVLAAMVWVFGVDPQLELSRTELRDECLHWRTVPPDTKLMRIEIRDIERTVFPPAVTCTYGDVEVEADLLATERAYLLLCGAAFVVFSAIGLSQVARASRPRSDVR
ncbi:hypothetical protein ACIHAR_34225 [Streptomyces sp. NPDC052016]|uniref:hypothetical protein n=1 Tax=Streptomyces sp. NPDC052016 TaxID=3365680 RepID=UPI0037D0AFEB